MIKLKKFHSYIILYPMQDISGFNKRSIPLNNDIDGRSEAAQPHPVYEAQWNALDHVAWMTPDSASWRQFLSTDILFVNLNPFLLPNSFPKRLSSTLMWPFSQ
jgi:hypothetical protein